MQRCPWVPEDKPLYVRYHDDEWGRPSHDARQMFEMICLEGMQAGLSWWVVLQKREHYRALFHQFDAQRVARMSDARLEEILLDPRVIRNRRKLWSLRQNARAWLELERDTGDPVRWLWSFVGGKCIVSRPRRAEDLRGSSPESERLSKELRKRGFGFVGPTTVYSFLQATGLVDDHFADCFRAQ